MGDRGATRNRHRMRCRDCEARHKRARRRGEPGINWRFTLRRHPKHYRRPIRCPRCKSLNVCSNEQQRRREDARQGRCLCSAYPFPHRPGTLRFCHQNPNVDDEPTPEEVADYEALLARDRRGWY